MKTKPYILSLLAVMALASCGGTSSSQPAASSSEPESSSEATSSQSLPSFETFTLSQLHDARVAKTLSSLENKYVAVKGKVTFAKHVDDDRGALTIQNGKYAVEVTYPSVFNVNVGDSVEVKGKFAGNLEGEIATIWISTYRETLPNSDIKVINETIETETVTIAKEADLIEYQASQSSIAFTVTGNRTNAAFIGKLSEGDSNFIVANRIDVAEKFPEAPYTEGDNVSYQGIFTYSGDSSAKVIRYFDKAGFSKVA